MAPRGEGMPQRCSSKPRRSAAALCGCATALAGSHWPSRRRVRRAGRRRAATTTSRFDDKFLNAIGFKTPDRPMRHQIQRALAAGGAADARSAAARRAVRAAGAEWPKDPDVERQASKAKKDDKPRLPVGLCHRRTHVRCVPTNLMRRPIARNARKPGIDGELDNDRSVELGKKKLLQLRLVQEGRVRDVHRRAVAGQPDRSAGRLSDAVARSALRHRPGDKTKYKDQTVAERMEAERGQAQHGR